MKCARLVGSLAALMTLLAPGVAHAQIFSVYTPPPKGTEPAKPGEKERFRRLQIGAFAAIWDQPPVTNLNAVFNISVPPGFTTAVIPAKVDPDVSPLITADYYITRQLSIGGWWNPMSGTAGPDLSKVPPGTFPPGAKLVGDTNFHFNDNFYDFHLTYYFPKHVGFLPEIITDGLSVQGGYSIQNIGLRAPENASAGVTFLNNGVLTSRKGFSLFSPNVWVTKRVHLGDPTFGGKRRHPVNVFGSGGYYTSHQFDHAWNAMGGVTVGLRPDLDLSVSYWRVMGRTSDDQDRISVGLTAHY